MENSFGNPAEMDHYQNYIKNLEDKASNDPGQTGFKQQDSVKTVKKDFTQAPSSQ